MRSSVVARSLARVSGPALFVIAVAHATFVLAQTPSTPSPAETSAMRLLSASDWAGAVPAFSSLTKADPSNPRAWFGLGVSLHETGKFAEARDALLQSQTRQYAPPNQVRYRLARTYARLGDTAAALSTLEQMAASGFVNLPVLSHADFDTIKADPRFAAVLQGVNRSLHPCQADANFRKFDFWVGTWDVQPTGVPRAPSGGATSVVERMLDGCVIFENWTPLSGAAGKSINTYNTVTKKWEQYWADATGRITHYFGEFHDDGNLYYEADQFGTSNKIRMTFFNQGPNQVRQLGHVSTDGGKTWTVSFDLTYVRKS